MTIKVIKFKKLTSGAKKFEITFNKNGKTYTRKFGARGMSDFTIHKDKERRERYITRHKKDLRTNDPMKPGYLSMYILWNKPSVSGSLADYKRRLNTYNRTGKFPKGITGSKKLNSRFGALVDFDVPNSYLNKIPGDVQNLIQREVSASKLQKGVRGREWPSKLMKEFFDHVYKHYIVPGIASSAARWETSYKEEFNSYKYTPSIATEQYHTKPGFMGNWFKRVAKLPTESFFERDKESARQLTDIIEEYLLKFRHVEENDGMMPDTALDIHEEDVLGITTSLIIILIKSKFPMSRIPPDVLEEISDLEEAYIPDPDESFWAEAHDYWRSDYSNFGALVDFNIPNTYLDKLPGDVQDLIQRELSASKLQKGARGREWPSKLMKEFLDHVKRYYIEPERRSRQRGGSISSTQINYDQWFDDYKREPHVATEMHHTNPGFMGNWFRRLAKLPSVSFFKRQKSSIDITYMVREYLSKFRIATEYDDSLLDIHSEDVEDIASSLIAILIKSRFPISRIPPGVLEDLRDGYVPHLDRYHSINRYHSFWREAHIYWETNWPSRNSFGKSSSAPSNVVNKKLYMSIKAKIKRSIKGRRWGAYDSGRLVREYKAKGGKYSGGKGKTDLGRWYKEKWVDACAWPRRKSCGRKTAAKIAYCRPSKRVDSKTPKLVQSLSKAQRKSRCTKKKRSPMKRVTKFGQSTQDEVVPYGDGSWVIHCSYHPRGAHSTLRYKPLSVRPNDYSYHYGIHNDGTLKLWATGGAINTPISEFLYGLLVNYYNTRCIDISKTTQTDQSFYISDQYGTNNFGYTNFGYTTESAQNNMLKSLLSGNDVLKNLDKTIKKLCKGNFTKDKCQKLFTYFILNLYHTFNVKIPGGAPRGFKGITLKYKKSYNNNLKELLYLLQDHAFGTFKGARLASRLYELIF
tara:strand:+ start:16133 stop:18883 length:2751 start_codon:yes stop_codon:yes gene_type:complete